MSKTVVSNISLSKPTNNIDGYVMLSQEAWKPYVGKMTKMQAVGWLTKIIFAGPNPTSFCPTDDKERYEKVIYAFPSKESLHFKIGCSNGSLSGSIMQYIDFTELLQINLDVSPTLKYPALSITSFSFEGDVYNSKGEAIQQPRVEVINNSLRLSHKVYASLRVTYKVFRLVYTVGIRAREEYTENKFQSFVYAIWNGGTTYLEVEAPIGAESDAEVVTCANLMEAGFGTGQFSPVAGVTGGTTESELEVDSDNPFGKVSGEDENVDIDYCTQLVI